MLFFRSPFCLFFPPISVSNFVSGKLATIDGVRSTWTTFVLKKYKEHGIPLEKPSDIDERQLITP